MKKLFATSTGIRSWIGTPQFPKLRRVALSHDWFEIYELDCDVYAIFEPRHPQKVFSYLILGDSKAMLLDTGLGIASMKQVVEQLTDLPVLLVNTHSHYDHIGCNYEFGETYLFDYPPAVHIVESGLDHQAALEKLNFGTDVVDEVIYPEAFDAEKYCIPPSKVLPMREGDTFDLGGRVLKVWHTPGHSPDSVMLQDEANHILFTGDTLYPGKLYAFSTSADMGSDVPTYIAQLTRMSGMFSEYTLYCQHCEPVRPGSFLMQAAQALQQVIEKELPYQIADEGLRMYPFDGFSILRPNPQP